MRNALEMLTILNVITCAVARNLAGLMLMFMVLIVMLQIVFRYLLNDSLIWTEEVARTMMV
ncbi:MAG: TRAP transporter small permease subunit, partial [Pseudomonadales bacterium]|nr:TRAP transporter small permease subunit [Pseudomonadales bacterium]